MAWQKCPICDGTGIDQCVNGYANTTTCDVCNGKRIIHVVTGKPPGKYVKINAPQKLKFESIEDEKGFM